jgi:cold shock CspA family protein
MDIPDEVDSNYGAYVGVCKWFSDRLGYGFVTVCEGVRKGTDVFVHYKSIASSKNAHRVLCKGEYVSFDIRGGLPSAPSEALSEALSEEERSGLQAIDVTGVYGGTLMCDHATDRGFAASRASRSSDDAWAPIVRGAKLQRGGRAVQHGAGHAGVQHQYAAAE